MKETNLTIVGLFSKQLSQELTILQIKSKLKRSYHYVYDKVQELINQKILNQKTRGHSTVCTLNLKSEKAKALLILYSVNEQELFLNKNSNFKSLCHELTTTLVNKVDILSIILFGSYAKGTETKQSDIDLLIITGKKDKNNIVPREIHALETKYGLEINQIMVNTRIFQDMLKNKVELNVGKEALANHVILYGAELFWKFVLEVKNE